MSTKNRAAVSLGRRAKGVTSPLKRRTSAANGRLGGRPPKFVPGATAIGAPTAPVAIRGQRVEVLGPGRARASFVVRWHHQEFTVPSWRLLKA